MSFPWLWAAITYEGLCRGDGTDEAVYHNLHRVTKIAELLAYLSTGNWEERGGLGWKGRRKGRMK